MTKRRCKKRCTKKWLYETGVQPKCAAAATSILKPMKGLRGFLGAIHKAPGPVAGDSDLELHKHFKLYKQLGRGSFATVYEAERLADGKRYALKKIDLAALSQLDRVAVVGEIRLLASLRHPNIISFYEAFCDHDKLCVVTELVGGGDLSAFLRSLREHGGFLWEREVWSYFLQAALGVQYLHYNRVLHRHPHLLPNRCRDLKPQNIMLTKKKEKGGSGGLLKIADLGVSAQLARVFTTTQIGTPHYMAPEMWRHQPYSFSADIWALGCILHELCTLSPTFLNQHTRTEQDVKQQVLSGQYAAIPARYSADLTRLVGLMLRRDPSQARSCAALCCARPTIHEILAMPEVAAKLAVLPPEVLVAAAAGGGGERDGGGGGMRKSRSVEKLKVPDGGVAGDNSHLNCLMPPARYATGRGVAAQLCGGPPPLRRRSIPHPDLVQRAATTGIGKAAPGLAASSQALGGQAAQPGGQTWASGWGGGGEAGEGGEAEDLMRRRSIMVGDLLNRLHQEHQEAEAGAGANSRGMLPTIGNGGRVSADSIQGGHSQQLGSQQHGGSAVARGSLLYSGGGSAAAGGGDMAVAHGGSSGEQGRAFSLARRSVTIAEVQHHQDVEKKLGERPAGSDANLTKLAGTLVRQPFEFCARVSSIPGASHANAADAPVASSAVPAARQQQQQQQQQQGELQQPAAAVAGTGSSSSARARVGERQAQAEAQAKGKKKKKGKLWRLMWGAEEEAGMHQDVF
ncbi:Serine/threonine-protein kinase Nek7 [Chlorella vulgaris]